MDDKIIGLYAAGLTVRDIRAHLEDLYGLKVSADLISRVVAVDRRRDRLPADNHRRSEPVLPTRQRPLRKGRDDPDIKSRLC